MKGALSKWRKKLRFLKNISGECKSVSEEYKIAKLKAIFKKGARIDPKNYRPISLLLLESKII